MYFENWNYDFEIQNYDFQFWNYELRFWNYELRFWNQPMGQPQGQVYNFQGLFYNERPF